MHLSKLNQNQTLQGRSDSLTTTGQGPNSYRRRIRYGSSVDKGHWKLATQSQQTPIVTECDIPSFVKCHRRVTSVNLSTALNSAPGIVGPDSRLRDVVSDVRLVVDVVPGDGVARWQNLIPSFPWIAPGWRAWGAIQGKEGIKFCSVA